MLVVDECPETAFSLAEYVTLLGGHARAILDPGAALGAAREATPEIIFVDLGLTGADARALAEDLRRASSSAKLVGTMQDAAADRLPGSPFDMLLSRPYSFEKIRAALHPEISAS